ncbi:methyl-CpG-binding domain-containing protein 10-like isoform X2 [Phalaenopsis equestris]|uniref:methyl-CpG-binding domain-containing protein 10-like isoform X2 n=1 Tax=Phalaenopsis equestris TaxID=78828 RepID=UPI0009E1D985|nr:methyl-CpG-binding domain-containing protein 10-like isoform X2 [Phalaenopsis equestris]
MICLMLNMFAPKKAGTPMRNEIFFISPTGEVIRNKKKLNQYLRSHPGNLSSSVFDWGTGDTPRRSARISEKIKAMETLQEEPPKKRGRISSSKKEIKQKNGVVDEQAEDEALESRNVTTLGLESLIYAQMKNDEAGSVNGKELAATRAISGDNSKDDSIEGTNNEKDDLDAEVENEEPKSEEGVAIPAAENVEDVDIKDAVGSSLNVGKNEIAAEDIEDSFKVDSNEGAKHEKNNIDADLVDEPPESEKTATHVLESVNDADMNDAEDVSVKGKEAAATNAIADDGSAKVNLTERTKAEKHDVDAVVDYEALASEKRVAIQALESIDDVDSSVKGEKDTAAKVITVCSSSKVDSDEGSKQEKDKVVVDEAVESEKVAKQALKSVEDADPMDADGDSAGEEESAAKAIPEDTSVKVNSNDKPVKIDSNNEALESEIVSKQSVKSVEDADPMDADDDFVVGDEESAAKAFIEDTPVKVDSNDKPVEKDKAYKYDVYQDSAVNPAEGEENELKKQAQWEQSIDVTVISTQEETVLESENLVVSQVLTHKTERYKDNLIVEEVKDKPLLNDNHKGEQVSPSKVIPTANHVELQSPHKASALV